jgi:hypothetical protein
MEYLAIVLHKDLAFDELDIPHLGVEGGEDQHPFSDHCKWRRVDVGKERGGVMLGQAGGRLWARPISRREVRMALLVELNFDRKYTYSITSVS